MNAAEAIKAVSSQACHVSDEIVWAALTEEQKLSVARLFKDDVEELFDDSYERGREDGREEGWDDTRVYLSKEEEQELREKVLREIRNKLEAFLEGLVV